ncbi:MAG: SDR family NAD(P)-dependent oxidoreductase [Clostridia bacterium]|nr:SDR family NAD(P)-dependent oxidoreductase [Clostridia bacterium]
MSKLDFKDKLFVVSGASSGLGRILTEKLIADGCKVIGIGRNEAKFADFKATLGDKSDMLETEIFDVSDEIGWKNLAAKLAVRGAALNGLINCAGVFPPFRKAVDFTVPDIESVMKTNFLSAVYAVKNLLPLLEESGFPTIVNVSSAAALASIVGTSGYSASKSALKAYTEILAEELRGKAYVGLVMPGFARTDIMRSQNTSFDEDKLVKKMSMPADRMAGKIFRGITKKKRRMIFGFDAKILNFFYKLMPKTTTRLVAVVLKKSKMKLFDDVFR